MDIRLQDKVIAISGAARGIGAAVAQQAVESGAKGLLLTDRDPVPRPPGDGIETLTADLSDPSTPGAIITAALDAFGRLDGLVNAAGLTTRGSVEEGDAALFDHLMAVNARAPFLLMSGAIRAMRTQGAGGSIVNIQSVNADCGAPELAAYSASKGALQTLTANAANAHASDLIRVNGINLGWTDTETERHLHDVELGKGDGWLASQAASRPMGRFVSADDAARLAVYLLSDASAPMTGVSMDLEGGVRSAPR